MPERVGRSGRVVLMTGLIGVLLVPAGIVLCLGVFGILLPGGMLLGLGAIAVALLVSFGARLRWRARATGEEVSVECDFHLRSRGLGRTVVLVAVSMAFVLAIFAMRSRG